MKIFLSWSGQRSRIIANALREWLPLVVQSCDPPWLSERDIPAGNRWAVELGKKLEDMHFGIIVLTSENLHAPWPLFEAGALAKAFTEGGVCPYLVDVGFEDLNGGPISHFQGKRADRTGTYEMVQSINSRSDNPVNASRLRDLFEALWPRLEMELERLPPAKDLSLQHVTDPQAQRFIAEIAKLHGRIAEKTRFSTSTSLLIEFLVKIHMRRYVDALGAVYRSDKLPLPSEPRMKAAMRAISDAQNSIHAISLLSIDQWHHEKLRSRYVLANIDAANRGITVRRVFIVDSEPELENYKDFFHVLRKEADNIEMRYAVRQTHLRARDEMIDSTFPLVNLVICDGKVMTLSTSDARHDGELVLNADDIALWEDRFSLIWDLAHPL